jgi:aspartate 1-decarboxylase
LNGFPALGTRTTNPFFSAMKTASNFPSAAYTLFFVASQTTGASVDDSGGIFMIWAGNTRIGRNGSFNAASVFLDSTAIGVSGTVNNDQFYTYMIRGAANALEVEINGAASGISGLAGDTPIPSVLQIFQSQAGTLTANKKFVQIVAYERELDDAEVGQVTTYLKDKYGHY